jgi:hypothetical protein
MQQRIKVSGHRSLVVPPLVGGSLAAALSAAVLARRGQVELREPAAPLNAPAHWFTGRALRANRPSWRHTLLGQAIHWASALLWAGVYEMLVARRDPPPATLVAGAAGVTAAAALVDLKLVPGRLTPGFERRLSTRSTAATYVAFGAGLAVAGLLMRRR